jgi:hypothetical protein
LTINNTLSLAGTTFIELNRSAQTNDSINGLTAVTYGGTLVLTNLSGALAPDDAFKLFDASTYGGAFSTITPSRPGVGLVWDTTTLATDGTLRVALAPPSLNSIQLQGDSEFVFTGSNGLPNGGFSVLSSSNLVLPIADWLLISTGAFDSNGLFAYSNSVDPANSQQFFRIRQP